MISKSCGLIVPLGQKSHFLLILQIFFISNTINILVRSHMTIKRDIFMNLQHKKAQSIAVSLTSNYLMVRKTCIIQHGIL